MTNISATIKFPFNEGNPGPIECGTPSILSQKIRVFSSISSEFSSVVFQIFLTDNKPKFFTSGKFSVSITHLGCTQSMSTSGLISHNNPLSIFFDYSHLPETLNNASQLVDCDIGLNFEYDEGNQFSYLFPNFDENSFNPQFTSLIKFLVRYFFTKNKLVISPKMKKLILSFLNGHSTVEDFLALFERDLAKPESVMRWVFDCSIDFLVESVKQILKFFFNSDVTEDRSSGKFEFKIEDKTICIVQDGLESGSIIFSILKKEENDLFELPNELLIKCLTFHENSGNNNSILNENENDENNENNKTDDLLKGVISVDFSNLESRGQLNIKNRIDISKEMINVNTKEFDFIDSLDRYNIYTLKMHHFPLISLNIVRVLNYDPNSTIFIRVPKGKRLVYSFASFSKKKFYVCAFDSTLTTEVINNKSISRICVQGDKEALKLIEHFININETEKKSKINFRNSMRSQTLKPSKNKKGNALSSSTGNISIARFAFFCASKHIETSPLLYLKGDMSNKFRCLNIYNVYNAKELTDKSDVKVILPEFAMPLFKIDDNNLNSIDLRNMSDHIKFEVSNHSNEIEVLFNENDQPQTTVWSSILLS